jgi:hypothetical protein
LYVLGVKDLKDDNIKKLKNASRNFVTHVYNQSKGVDDNGNPKYPAREHLEALIKIINYYQEGSRVESRARYMGNTMYSHVAPSYLSDKLDVIKRFVDANDHNGLRNYLEDKFLNNPFFVNDDYLA